MKKITKKIRKAGLIPPIVDKFLIPNKRVWNEVDINGWDPRAVSAAIEGIIDYIPAEIQERGNNTILFCAQQKSASLYTSKLIAKVFNGKEYWIGFNKGGGGLYIPRFIGAMYSNDLTISHCHTTATSKIIKLLDQTKPRVLVSYRNLADTLVSRRDMLVKDKSSNNLLSDAGLDHFLESDPEEQLRITIEIYAQEYMNFYSSWRRVQDRFNVHFLKYDLFIPDQLKGLQDLSMAFFNKPLEGGAEQVINEIMTNGGVNFNKGKQGRGKRELTDKLKSRILEIAKLYKLEGDREYLGF